MKPKWTPPGTERLTLKYGDSPSNFAFKFNLRRYNKATCDAAKICHFKFGTAPGDGAQRCEISDVW